MVIWWWDDGTHTCEALYFCVWHRWSGNYWKCVSSEGRCAVLIWCNCMPAMQFLCRDARRYFSVHMHAWPLPGPGCTGDCSRKRNWTLPSNCYGPKRNVMLCIYRWRNKWCWKKPSSWYHWNTPGIVAKISTVIKLSCKIDAGSNVSAISMQRVAGSCLRRAKLQEDLLEICPL